jgi:hypothetical protein
MSSPKKPKHSLWYKYRDNEPVRIRTEQLPSLEEEPSVSDIKKIVAEEYDLKLKNVTLRIKRPIDEDYEELNDPLLNNCGNNYVTLKDNYGITKNNPIIANSVES